MGDLFPTKTRLALLDDVANGQVLTDITEDDDVILLFPNAPTEWQSRVRVTARIRELERAGWIHEDTHSWRLTAAGHTVLAADHA